MKLLFLFGFDLQVRDFLVQFLYFQLSPPVLCVFRLLAQLLDCSFMGGLHLLEGINACLFVDFVVVRQ